MTARCCLIQVVLNACFRAVGRNPTLSLAALLLMQTRRLAADALRLRLPAEPATLGAMRSALRRWLAAMGVDERAAYRIVLAANEAAANAIEHAYAATTAEFEVTAARERGAVVVSVRDWGRWRAPRDEHRGRGLQLMEAMMDEVRVERQADGTTVWLRRQPDFNNLRFIFGRSHFGASTRRKRASMHPTRRTRFIRATKPAAPGPRPNAGGDGACDPACSNVP